MYCIVYGVAKSWTRQSNFHFQCHTITEGEVEEKSLVEGVGAGKSQ